jgi:hypothetical protein
MRRTASRKSLVGTDFKALVSLHGISISMGPRIIYGFKSFGEFLGEKYKTKYEGLAMPKAYRSVVVSVSMPPELAEALKGLAESTGATVSELVRRAVSAHLAVAGATRPGGKGRRRLACTSLPEPLYLAVAEKARAEGYSVSEYLRRLLLEDMGVLK